MMPDLGQYATEVLTAYAGSLALLIAVVVMSVWKARRVQRRLMSVEQRREKSS
ncbi:heme exporter protein CcmD [Rhodophyticola porphyridii]|uniref:Heme exporter protein D n=2 Tax=Rhodophyticola porphyridii TaxID=1852017 RepID=A0A3L9Y7W6_9RHOB|nr:heme exporter protein CcmD [Rhodophyticola porphyridii]